MNSNENCSAEPSVRDTYAVGVLIYHTDLSPNGFRIHTAYPMNYGTNQKSISLPDAFVCFTGNFISDIQVFRGDDDHIRFAFETFLNDRPDQMGELAAFLKFLFSPGVTDNQRIDVWNRSNAIYSGRNRNIPRFLARILKIAETEVLTGKIGNIPIGFRKNSGEIFFVGGKKPGA